MKGLNTNTLLKNLIHYSFFDWDDEGNGIEPLLLGLPEAILKQHQVEKLYNSWGIEAVHNPHANPYFSAEYWLQLENVFFDWLNTGKNLYSGFKFNNKTVCVWGLNYEAFFRKDV